MKLPYKLQEPNPIPMNPVIEYLKKIVVVNIIFLFVSCSLLKSQEQRTLDDIKQIAKIHFENQFQINKNSKRGKNDTFIYFSINQEDNFKTFFEEDKIKQYIKDSGVYKKLFNEKELIKFYKNKTIFVTGAGGSIGSEILKQFLKLPIKKIVAFGRGENSIHELNRSLGNEKRYKFVIGDIRDKNKLDCEIKKYKPNFLFHVAAHKHVYLMEKFPDEALKNNVIGTNNCADICIKNNVANFILISTDKAVNPTSFMGATKRLAEKIILSKNYIQNITNFSLTRFGNVLGSRGSVVPIFEEQIKKGGPITITDKEVTRFFMSIREAARLVIKSGTIKKGKIFVLDMGKSVKILELAKELIKLNGFNENDIPIVITGLKNGEKLHEEVFSKNEKLEKSNYEKILISHNNEKFYTSKKIKKMLKKLNKILINFDKKELKKFIKNYIPEYKGN